jgi:hypothetical protein
MVIFSIAFCASIIIILAANLVHQVLLAKILLCLFAGVLTLVLFAPMLGIIAHNVGNGHSRTLHKSSRKVPGEVSDASETDEPSKMPFWVFPVVFLALLFILSKCGGANQPATNKSQRSVQQPAQQPQQQPVGIVGHKI